MSPICPENGVGSAHVDTPCGSRGSRHGTSSASSACAGRPGTPSTASPTGAWCSAGSAPRGRAAAAPPPATSPSASVAITVTSTAQTAALMAADDCTPSATCFPATWSTAPPWAGRTGSRRASGRRRVSQPGSVLRRDLHQSDRDQPGHRTDLHAAGTRRPGHGRFPATDRRGRSCTHRRLHQDHRHHTLDSQSISRGSPSIAEATARLVPGRQQSMPSTAGRAPTTARSHSCPTPRFARNRVGGEARLRPPTPHDRIARPAITAAAASARSHFWRAIVRIARTLTMPMATNRWPGRAAPPRLTIAIARSDASQSTRGLAEMSATKAKVPGSARLISWAVTQRLNARRNRARPRP